MDKISYEEVYIKIVYIDDHVDESVSEYLDAVYSNQSYHDEIANRIVHKECKEITFKEDDTYEKLLINPDVQNANIILIDNYLFEEKNARDKFTGKQFKLILQELFPFIQTLVITQDQNLLGRNIVHKYDSREAGSGSKQYYEKELGERLNNAVSDILEFRDESIKLGQDAEDDTRLLSERIHNSLMGITAYRNLTKDDIDTLVKAFRELKKYVGDRT